MYVQMLSMLFVCVYACWSVSLNIDSHLVIVNYVNVRIFTTPMVNDDECLLKGNTLVT